MSAELEPTSPETNELLRLILRAVEPTKPTRGFEVACAIILSLATTASAWCAYQSKLWGGAQTSRANTAVRAGREAAVNTLAALPARSFAASMFIACMQARINKASARRRRSRAIGKIP
jgi:hypothetical protein